MLLSDLAPAVDERMFIAGQTGTGKTTLIKRLIEPISKHEPVIVIDSKDDWQARHWWEPWRKEIYQFLPGVSRMIIKNLKPGLYVFKPRYPDWADPRLSLLFQNIFNRKKRPKKNERNITVVIDELFSLSRGTTAMASLGKLITQGRSKHIRMFIGTQRPAAIPLIGITEAKKVASFFLLSEDDRKRLGKWISPKLEQNPGPGPYDFWFKHIKDRSETLIHQGEGI